MSGKSSPRPPAMGKCIRARAVLRIRASPLDCGRVQKAANGGSSESSNKALVVHQIQSPDSVVSEN